MNNLNLSSIGFNLMRVGVAGLLAWFGLFKFTPTEAADIKPLLQFSPFVSWMLAVFGERGASNLIGGVEILTAGLLIAGIWQPMISLAGSLLGSSIFAITLTFLFSTPGMVQFHDGMWVPDGFLAKDIVLLGFCLYNGAAAAATGNLVNHRLSPNQSVAETT